MKVISFKVPKQDIPKIRKCVDRAMKLALDADIEYDRMTCDMDITACHANGNKLDLDKLLIANDFNFSHDVFGIRRHINRDTGELMNCFSPRSTAAVQK